MRTLRLDIGRLGGGDNSKKGKDKARTRDLIPLAFQKYAADIHTAGRRAAYSLNLWIDETWFQYKRQPDIDYKNPLVVYESPLSQQKAMAAKTYVFLRGQDCVIDLSTLIGEGRWLWKVVRYSSYCTCNLLT